MGQDVMDLTHKTMKEYLDEDPHNMVILEGNRTSFTNVNHLNSLMEDSVVFECKESNGRYNIENVIHTFELFNAVKLGFTGIFIDNSSVQKAMKFSISRNQRVYRLSEPGRSISAVVGKSTLKENDIVSGNHCQPGAYGDLRTLNVVNLSVSFIRIIPEEIKNDFFTILMYKTMAVHSDENKLSFNQLEKIKDAWNVLESESNITKSYTKYVTNAELTVYPGTDMVTLQKISNILNPRMRFIHIEMPEIKNFSFMKSINNLIKFSSQVPVDFSNVIGNLGNNYDSLSTVSMPIEMPIDNNFITDLSKFKYLKKLYLTDFNDRSQILESIGTSTSIQLLHLNSSKFDGPLDGIVGIRESLEDLKIIFSKFTGDVTPLLSLNKLEFFEVHFPSLNRITIGESLSEVLPVLKSNKGNRNKRIKNNKRMRSQVS